jgi:peptide/nickel transport system substrate-binding protein
MRAAKLCAAALAAVALATGCGGSAGPGQAGHGSQATAITVLTSSVPPSLDPGVAFGQRAMAADWLAYTPLLTYAHARGVTGTQPIAGLATDLPTITDSGTTYSLTLRPGLVYSGGAPVKASDFAWAVERAIKLGWPGAPRYILGRVVGATEFAQGRAATIAGISADDATGRITIRLAAAYGQFEDVLALPALAPVPRSTPLRDERAAPPPGVGPYRLAAVAPGRSYSLVLNPAWEQTGIPGIPRGRLDIHVRVSPSRATAVRAVARGAADVLDPADHVPRDALAAVAPRTSALYSSIAARYLTTAASASWAIVLSTASRPFSSQLARWAVMAGLNRKYLEGLAGGAEVYGCYLLPPPLPGHLGGSCGRTRKLALARTLLARSGLAGTPVTVSNEAGPEAGAIASYYVSLLDRIGFRASLSLPSAGTAGSRGAQTGNLGSPGPQTWIALIAPDLPNPMAAYEQWGPAVNDPRIAAQLRLLSVVPVGRPDAVSSMWKALDAYTFRMGYVPVLGYPTISTLVSSRIAPRSVILHPVAGIDWSWLDLA